MRSDRIKEDANIKKARVESQLTEIDSDTKAGRDAGNKDRPHMIVCQVRF